MHSSIRIVFIILQFYLPLGMALIFIIAPPLLHEKGLGGEVFGQPYFQKTFGEISNDGGYSVRQTSDGGYIITGWTNNFGAGAEDFYLLKTVNLQQKVD